MERLASVFGIDVLSYAILSNHLHIVARNRPDVVNSWSDEQVALRWLRIFPGCHADEFLGDPTQHQVDTLARNPQRIATLRTRLSDFSWFMKALCEPIARLANFQDQVTGHFWEGRFKAQAITDEASLLACSMYVDLNPIRAAMAGSPNEAKHTSVYDRIHADQGAKIPSSAAQMVTISREEAGRIRLKSSPDQLRKRQSDAKKRKGDLILRDAWLAPLRLEGQRGKDGKERVGPMVSKSGVRASDKGFLTVSVSEYVKLMNWVLVNMHKLGSKVVPKALEASLTSIQMDGNMLCDMIKNFKKYFGRGSATGSPESLKENAEQRERRFVRGQRTVGKCFSIVG
jgi:hypothetical protein